MIMGRTTLGAGIRPAEEEGTTEEGEAVAVEVVEEAEVIDMSIIE